MVFEEMSLVALKQYAKEKGMKGVSALKKSRTGTGRATAGRKEIQGHKRYKGEKPEACGIRQWRKSKWNFGGYAGWIWIYPL